MEVRAISQGGQPNFEVKKLTNEKTAQLANNYSADKIKVIDNNIKDREINEKDIKDAVGKVNKFLEDNGTHAEYEVHEKLNDIMIRIVDNKTKEVVQEIPSRKILDMVAKMMEMVGVLFDKKA